MTRKNWTGVTLTSSCTTQSAAAVGDLAGHSRSRSTLVVVVNSPSTHPTANCCSTAATSPASKRTTNNYKCAAKPARPRFIVAPIFLPDLKIW